MHFYMIYYGAFDLIFRERNICRDKLSAPEDAKSYCSANLRALSIFLYLNKIKKQVSRIRHLYSFFMVLFFKYASFH